MVRLRSGKFFRCTGDACGKLRDEQVIARDQLLKSGILFRVCLVERRSDDGDSPAAILDGRRVGGRVDPLGQAADDDHVLLHQRRRKLGCAANAFGACLARSDDRHPRPFVEKAGIAGRVQHFGACFCSTSLRGPSKSSGAKVRELIFRLAG